MGPITYRLYTGAEEIIADVISRQQDATGRGSGAAILTSFRMHPNTPLSSQLKTSPLIFPGVHGGDAPRVPAGEGAVWGPPGVYDGAQLRQHRAIPRVSLPLSALLSAVRGLRCCTLLLTECSNIGSSERKLRSCFPFVLRYR